MKDYKKYSDLLWWVGLVYASIENADWATLGKFMVRASSILGYMVDEQEVPEELLTDFDDLLLKLLSDSKVIVEHRELVKMYAALFLEGC